MAYLYFISTDGETFVKLDCEETITVSKSNAASKSSVMEGANISDGFIEGNTTIAVQGMVTYSKTEAQKDNPNPYEFVTEINNKIRSHERFTVYADSTYSRLLRDVDDCIITSFSYVVDKFENAITVDITFEEMFVSSAAKVTYLPPKPAKVAVMSISGKQGTGTTRKTDVSSGSSGGKVVPEGLNYKLKKMGLF